MVKTAKASTRLRSIENNIVEVDRVVVSQHPAQILAEKIWAGQSPDLTRQERLDRVARGLSAQGLDINDTNMVRNG
jgi:hypothetical protein